MKHKFGWWAFGSGNKMYGVAGCIVCGLHYHLGNTGGCEGKPSKYVSNGLKILLREIKKEGKKK
ncbi:hypothetical protein LCGC14_2349340 [marine sediment metagenome]|uniref:Uncharacterized protein n=1 Tax=marine sediment metagenome TaxID=412755 RepID=A0A0F9F4Q2_9ZZZZ